VDKSAIREPYVPSDKESSWVKNILSDLYYHEDFDLDEIAEGVHDIYRAAWTERPVGGLPPVVAMISETDCFSW
jgi:hypothetical protein